jgi:hypothetical protein
MFAKRQLLVMRQAAGNAAENVLPGVAKATRRRTVWSAPATAGKRADVGWTERSRAEGAGMEFVICASRKYV